MLTFSEQITKIQSTQKSPCGFAIYLDFGKVLPGWKGPHFLNREQQLVIEKQMTLQQWMIHFQQWSRKNSMNIFKDMHALPDTTWLVVYGGGADKPGAMTLAIGTKPALL